jgi:hypothetical protein
MEGTRIKKVFKAKFEGVRSVGKPGKRWEDAVQQDAASFLRCRNWKLAASDRTFWRQKIEEANARLLLISMSINCDNCKLNGIFEDKKKAVYSRVNTPDCSRMWADLLLTGERIKRTLGF